jgi:hypothetical protein
MRHYRRASCAGVPVVAKIALAIDAERPDCIVLHGRGHMLRKQAGRASGCDPHPSRPDGGHCQISSSLEAGHIVYPPPRNRKCRLVRDSMHCCYRLRTRPRTLPLSRRAAKRVRPSHEKTSSSARHRHEAETMVQISVRQAGLRLPCGYGSPGRRSARGRSHQYRRRRWRESGASNSRSLALLTDPIPT